MFQIKNNREGMLIIPLLSLKLSSGQVVELEQLCPLIQEAIDQGRLTLLDSSQNSQVSISQEVQNNPVVDLSKLTAVQAIAKINEEKDGDVIRSMMEKEKRHTVIDALKARLEDL